MTQQILPLPGVDSRGETAPTDGYSVPEFKIVRLRECFPADRRGDTPDAIANFWRIHVPSAAWYQEEKETFVVFFLNTRMRIKGFNMVSIGTLDTILVHPREVYRPAVIANAHSIVIAHNHPSGDTTPSQADIRATRDLIRAGQLLKIDCVDHIIIGRKEPGQIKDYASLRELGYFYAP